MEREAYVRTARDCMRDNVQALPLDLPLGDAVEHLLTHSQCAAPIVDPDGVVVGVLSEFDCLRCLASADYHGWPAGTVRDIATCKPITVRPDTDMFELASLFQQHRIRQLPVVDEQGRLLGMVARPSLLRALDAARREREHAQRDSTYTTIEKHLRPGTR
ncbi:MAG: CBS domain-containing protein [Planctomycetes bacterium]|nr:CBS domain-containing protein [Planctomycetota bacterium]